MSVEPKHRHYAAVLILSMSILALEIAVARVLSVALVSHYAFVAISLAMFGLGFSGLIVYLAPNHFTAERLDDQIARNASLFALTSTASVVVFMSFKVVQELSVVGFITLSAAYIVLALPFFYGGLCISLVMTHCSPHMSRIYFADLIGASLGAIGIVGLLELMSAPRATLAIAILAAFTSAAIARYGKRRTVLLNGACIAVIGALIVAGFATDLYRMKYVKVWDRYYGIYEAWNSFSRVSVLDSALNAAQRVSLPKHPNAYADERYPKTKMLDIDGAAWTPMMNYNGDPDSIQFLKDSVLFQVHHLKKDADVLLIGLGGGRDILAAKAFDQQSVIGIELNPLMEHIVQDKFGSYSGKPYTLPGVRVIIDEARSRLHRIDQQFDIIQLSLIDTLSLNAAGGFVFSENYLYTVEAYQEYYRHLKKDGILVMSRHYLPAYPVELLRMAALGRAAWEAEGIDGIADRLAVFGQFTTGVVLLKKSSFSGEEIRILKGLVTENNLTVVYMPGMSGNEEFVELVTTPDLLAYTRSHRYRIDPTTDDQPFFWDVLRGRLERIPAKKEDPFQFNKRWDEALAVMHLLIGSVAALAAVFFFGPLLLLRGRVGVGNVGINRAGLLLFYFGCLGYGFMMIEVPLMQRLILLLGYPVYALAVVLCGLLLYLGIGSLLSRRLEPLGSKGLFVVLGAVLFVGGLYGVWLPDVIDALLPGSMGLKIAVTVALLAPIGVPMGMAYPLGIHLLRRYSDAMVPWAWAMNGAMSVVAAASAPYLASQIGFTRAWFTGVGAYALAVVAVWWLVGTGKLHKHRVA